MDIAANKNPDDVEVIRAGFHRIVGRGKLIGTAALWMRGYEVSVSDVDFLVGTPQQGTDVEPTDGKLGEFGSVNGSCRIKIDGVKVEYVYADETRVRFMKAAGDWIDGVPVASVEDVLGLKVQADRFKDREFLKAWNEGRIGRRA